MISYTHLYDIIEYVRLKAVEEVLDADETLCLLEEELSDIENDDE